MGGHKVADEEEDGHDCTLSARRKEDAGEKNAPTCSATETTFDPVTSATVILRALAALRSMWSDPTPAVMQILRFFALAITSAVAYPGWKGVVMSTLRRRLAASGTREMRHVLGVDNVLLEIRVGALLVVRDNVLDALLLAVVAEAEGVLGRSE